MTVEVVVEHEVGICLLTRRYKAVVPFHDQIVITRRLPCTILSTGPLSIPRTKMYTIVFLILTAFFGRNEHFSRCAWETFRIYVTMVFFEYIWC